jgi:hypothetical protein
LGIYAGCPVYLSIATIGVLVDAVDFYDTAKGVGNKAGTAGTAILRLSALQLHLASPSEQVIIYLNNLFCFLNFIAASFKFFIPFILPAWQLLQRLY